MHVCFAKKTKTTKRNKDALIINECKENILFQVIAENIFFFFSSLQINTFIFIKK
jgi:hypothetical protein